jgi:threonine synthase
MQFVSTATNQQKVSFKHTLCHPIPSPGHLWMPEKISCVQFPPKDCDLKEFVHCVMSVFAPGIWRKDMLDNFAMPLALTPKTFRNRDAFELELFHGPTEAFKDVGCFVAAQVYKELFDPEKYRVIVATSGDTGGAVAHAFSKTNGLPVTILYPMNRISPYQERQIVHVPDPYHRIIPATIDGDFDQCQTIVKDTLMKYPNTISSNSISLARLLPQIAYHAWCAAQFDDPVTLIVPSGNMGNACSAIMAKQMGANIRSIHIACNENDSVERFINHKDTGYRPKTTVQTLATAMDVGKPSNFIRLCHLVNLKTCEYITASRTGNNDIQTIQNEMNCCPHTAIGYHASLFVNDRPIVVLATASPKKFIERSSSPLYVCRTVQTHHLHLSKYNLVWLVGLKGFIATLNVPEWSGQSEGVFTLSSFNDWENVEVMQREGIFVYLCRDPTGDSELTKEHRWFHRRWFLSSTFVIPESVENTQVRSIVRKIIGKKF